MFARLVAALLLSAAAIVSAAGQTTTPSTPPLLLKSVYGRDLYEFYCAACHGRDGRGGGPVAQALAARPSDLTTIAARTGGEFPRARVHAAIAGEPLTPIPAHGTSDMPVWGPIFRALDPSDPLQRVRISNLVDFVESIQRPPATPR